MGAVKRFQVFVANFIFVVVYSFHLKRKKKYLKFLWKFTYLYEQQKRTVKQ